MRTAMFAKVRAHCRLRGMLLPLRESDRLSRKIMTRIILFLSGLIVVLTVPGLVPAQDNISTSLTQAQASHFAALALKCVQKDYPNKPDHTINDKDDVRSPREMH